jgi:ketosteroid isomerase-like protein
VELPSNVGVARAILAAINDRDLDAVLFHAEPDVEVIAQRSEFEGPFSGHSGLARAVRDLWELAEDYEIVLEEVTEIDGRVLAIGRQRGRARESGLPIDFAIAGVFEMSGGRVAAVRMYASPEEARQAAGIPAPG